MHPGHGSTISIVTLVLLAATVLSVTTRLGMKFFTIRKFETDDLVILVALVFSVGQSIAVLIQSLNGLGEHMNTLTAHRLDVFQKTGYASDILYVISLGLSKVSVLFLLLQISPEMGHERRFLQANGVFVLVWALVGIFAAAFQCKTPETWQIIKGSCVKRTAFWDYFGITNIISEVLLIGFPIYVLLDVKLRTQKLVLVGCFGSRVLVIVATILQLVYLGRVSGSKDPTFDIWLVTMFTQLVQNLSIITACIPYIKNFYLNIESGMIRTDDLRRRQLSTSTFGYWSKHSNSTRKSSQATSKLNRSRNHSHSYDMNNLL